VFVYIFLQFSSNWIEKRMELVYTVAKSHRHKRRDFVFRNERPLISLSARNSLALCTTAALTDDKAEQYVN